MKSYREELWFETKTRRAYLNITRQVEGTNFLWGVRRAETKARLGEGDWIVSAMSFTRWPGFCVNNLVERLLPREKFGNMGSSAARSCCRSVSTC